MLPIKDKYICFFSSPKDCEQELIICHEIIDEFNSQFAKSHGFKVELISFENIRPGMAEYPQDVVNKQIDGKYDIYIGMMKKRYGTPTKVEDSATVEEFKRAQQRHINGGNIEIMFYFYDGYILMDEIDTSQIDKIRNFKNSMDRCLYSTFNESGQFKLKFKQHIEGTFSELFPNTTEEEKCGVMEIVNEKSSSYEYTKLWQEMCKKLTKNEDIRDDIEKIISAKKKNKFPKNIFNQSAAITHILLKKTIYREDAIILTQAIDELGLIPEYYSKVISDFTELEKLPEWQLLNSKENTLKGELSLIDTNNDDSIYENIQRLLFNLEFDKAKSLLDEWDARGYWILPKAMRIACFTNERDYACELLDDFIKKEKNITYNLYARQFANYINNSYPMPYPTEQFTKFDIDDVGEMLNYMTGQLREKPYKIKRRGWIGTTIDFGSGYPEYEKSLRILRYISDSGIFLRFENSCIYDSNSWYLAFENLFEEFPYPCFFYSLQYRSKQIQDRIGQDFAFSKQLVEFNQIILVKAIAAIGNKGTPQTFVEGLLNITGKMYVSVNESFWFYNFKIFIFKKMLEKIGTIKSYDPIVSNVACALFCIKDAKHVESALCDLICHYKENPQIVETLICSHLRLSVLKNKVNNDFYNTLHSVVGSFPETDITRMMYTFKMEDLLTNALVNDFNNKVKSIKAEQLPEDLASSYYLCLLTSEDNEAQQIAKKNFLKKDMWNNGITNDGKSFTHPDYLCLDNRSSKITWAKKELDLICDNLTKNIGGFSMISLRKISEIYCPSDYAEYLLSIIKFIDSLSPKRQTVLSDIKQKTQQYMNEILQHKTFVEQMMSSQSWNIYFAMKNLLYNIQVYGIEKYINEVNFIFDRVILCNDQSINSVLRTICILVKKYPKEILRWGLTTKLNIILDYLQRDWEEYKDLRPDISFPYLNSIAKDLKDSHQTSMNDDVVKFWLTDEYVMRFVDNS